MMMTTLNTKGKMVYGGQITSGYCFANLNYIIRSNLVYCFASAFVRSVNGNIHAGEKRSKCGAIYRMCVAIMATERC